MPRAFRLLFEKLKETNANEWSQGCRSRPGHHPGLEMRPLQETKDPLPR